MFKIARLCWRSVILHNKMINFHNLIYKKQYGCWYYSPAPTKVHFCKIITYSQIQIQINKLLIFIEKISPLTGFEPLTSGVASPWHTNVPGDPEFGNFIWWPFWPVGVQHQFCRCLNSVDALVFATGSTEGQSLGTTALNEWNLWAEIVLVIRYIFQPKLDLTKKIFWGILDEE